MFWIGLLVGGVVGVVVGGYTLAIFADCAARERYQVSVLNMRRDREDT